MIEPQNTLLPIAPQSRAKETPGGEMGFGEMLAQTLGMVPQLNPNAIVGIAADSGSDEDSNPGVDADESDATASRSATAVAGTSLGLVGAESSPRVFPLGRPPLRDALVLAPVVPGDSDVAKPPVATIPEPPSPEATAGITPPARDDGSEPVAVPAAPVDGPPIDADESVGGDDPAPAPEELTFVPAAVKPARKDLPERPQPPTTGPPPVVSGATTNEMSEAAAIEMNTAPASPVNVANVGRVDGAETPAGQHNRVMGDAAGKTDVAAPSESTVSLERNTTRVAADQGRVSIPDGRVSLDPANPVATPAAAPTSPAAQPAVNLNSHVTAAQHTALAERVLEAVELQANQPPPRTMIVDIPEIEGLRLVVSVRSGAEVHVVPASTSTATNGLHGFMNELDGVLANRGFVMTGDGRRRGNNPQTEEEADVPRRPRPTMNRPVDNDLRI